MTTINYNVKLHINRFLFTQPIHLFFPLNARQLGHRVNSLPALIGFPVPANVTTHPGRASGQRTAPAKHPPIVDRSFLRIGKRTVRRVDLHELISRRRPIGSRHVWMADPGQSPVRRFDVLARRAERNLQNLVERGGRRRRRSKRDLV